MTVPALFPFMIVLFVSSPFRVIALSITSVSLYMPCSNQNCVAVSGVIDSFIYGRKIVWNS